MTEKELHKLRREDLLDMLIHQSEDYARLTEELAKAKEELSRRALAMENAGTLADAAFQLNGVYHAADEVCSQYVESIRQMHEQQLKIQEECLRQKVQSEEYCRRMEETTREQCRVMLETARAEADRYWEEMSAKIMELHWKSDDAQEPVDPAMLDSIDAIAEESDTEGADPEQAPTEEEKETQKA